SATSTTRTFNAAASASTSCPSSVSSCTLSPEINATVTASIVARRCSTIGRTGGRSLAITGSLLQQVVDQRVGELAGVLSECAVSQEGFRALDLVGADVWRLFRRVDRGRGELGVARHLDVIAARVHVGRVSMVMRSGHLHPFGGGGIGADVRGVALDLHFVISSRTD